MTELLFAWSTGLGQSVGTIDQMICKGKITDADGWMKVGKLNRFIRRVMIERCEARLFARRLDREDTPMARSPEARKLRAIGS